MAQTLDTYRTGIVFPATVSDLADAGHAWASPNNVTANDTAVATCILLLSQKTNTLKCTGFTFGIPDRATVLGYTVSINRRGSVVNAVKDSVVLLTLAGTDYNDKAVATLYPSSLAVATYGSAPDAWGVSLAGMARDTVNLSTFGVKYQAIASGLAATVSVDSIGIEVFYRCPNVCSHSTEVAR